jgi:hypothetical protein
MGLTLAASYDFTLCRFGREKGEGHFIQIS